MTVPTGTVQDVLDWVGDDPARAQEALDAEQAGQQRSTLIAQLESIAAKEATDVSETTTDTETDEREEIIDPDPDVVIDTTNNDTTVGTLHRRHTEVEVPDYDDLNNVETIEADPVEYFQLAGAPYGAIFSFNGAVYSLRPSQVAAFKASLDSVVTGLSL